MGEAITPKQMVPCVRKLGFVIGLCIDGDAAREANKALTRLLGHIEALEALLDETDDMDFFGTQGWRYRAGIDNN